MKAGEQGSWVMLRALRQYLEDEGAEIVEDVQSLAELDRGESAPFEESIREVREIIGPSSPPGLCRAARAGGLR
jgi:predicted transcriptional regulator